MAIKIYETERTPKQLAQIKLAFDLGVEQYSKNPQSSDFENNKQLQNELKHHTVACSVIYSEYFKGFYHAKAEAEKQSNESV